jgi:hypothetical protein
LRVEAGGGLGIERCPPSFESVRAYSNRFKGLFGFSYLRIERFEIGMECRSKTIRVGHEIKAAL